MASQNSRSAKVIRQFNIVALTLTIVGVLGFLLSGIASLGVAKWWPGDIELPAAISSGVVFIDGHYYVPHPLSRVQVFDENWNFSHSFYVPSDGGVFSVAKGVGANITVYTARGSYVLQYSRTGQLLTQRTYDYEYPNAGVTMVVPTPWYLWPVSHPFGFWLVGSLGLFLHAGLDKLRK